MASLGIDTSLTLLKWLETEWDLEDPLKVKVVSLRFKLSFLTTFFRFKGKWQIDNENLKVLLTRVRVVVFNAHQDLQPIHTDLFRISSNEKGRILENLDSQISSVLESIELIKPNILEIYGIISNSFRVTSTSILVKHVMGPIESLLENMEDLIGFGVDSFAPLRKEMEAVEVSLRFLRDFLGFIAGRCSKRKYLKDLPTHVEVLADNIACLLCLCLVNSKMDDDHPKVHEIKLGFFCQLEKAKPIQPQAREIYIKALKGVSMSPAGHNIPKMDKFVLGFLDSLLCNMMELSDTKMCLMIPAKDQVLALKEELRFFKYYVIHRPPKKDSKLNSEIYGVIKRVTSLICEAGCVIYSFYKDERNGDMARELNSAVSDLLAKVKVAKEETREIYQKFVPKSLRFNFPSTNEASFISSLLQSLKEMLNSKAYLVAPLKHYIEEVQEGLSSLQEDFSAIAMHPSKHEELKDQFTHFKDIAYLTEYVIDSFVIGDYPLLCYKLGLLDVIEETKMIRTELRYVQKKITADTLEHEISNLPSQAPPIQADFLKIDLVKSSKDAAADRRKKPTAEMMVFGDEAEKIKEQLINRLAQLHILSIVGMPGIGKTTLADSIFENPSITKLFHACARCCVSQAYQKKRLFLEILQQVTGQTDAYNRLSDDDLGLKVYQCLKGKRYLIFLDDIWDIEHWRDIKSSFPDDNTQSRIMFTSRFHDISLQVESKCITYPLCPLSDEKSWEMLQIKLFPKESCPGELVEIGQKIAKYCKGLALTIDLVAGLLRMAEQNSQHWRQVAKNLTTKLLDDPERRCKNALELSYHHLPDHLKPCFLYFGAFPEDTDVPTRELIWMWIAEGFVQLQNPQETSLEYMAETYLNDLIARSLITTSKRKSLGGVKASSVHDLIHEFALEKAKEDNFLQQINGDANFSTSSLKYRLCINDHWFHFAGSYPSGPRVRSLFYRGILLPFFSASLNSLKFQLLRVLDLMKISFSNFPNVVQLVHLRFLALHCPHNDLISKIVKLQNLETFLLKIVESDNIPVMLVDSFCNMKRLRHFHILGPFILRLLDAAGEMDRLDNLQSLSVPTLPYGEETEEIMQIFPNIRRLKCELCTQRNCITNNNGPKLEFLSQLDSLNASYAGDKIPCPWKFSFPVHLKKLSLSNFRLPWSEISVIGKLEQLVVLKLQDGAFEGEIWNMRDNEFSKLKFLSLSGLNIEQWNASEDHLPCLERLLVQECKKLKELPSCFANIVTLEMIQISQCFPSVEVSAMNIKKDQTEMGYEQLEVNID